MKLECEEWDENRLGDEGFTRLSDHCERDSNLVAKLVQEYLGHKSYLEEAEMLQEYEA